MLIGIPKEIMHGERRVSAIPETVAKLVKDGAEVWVEKNAGEGAFFHDNQYVQAGAKIVDDVAVIYEKADVILKVKEPQFNHEKNLHEVDMMHAGQVLITFIHPASPVNHDMVRAMAKKGVVGLTLDGVPAHHPRAEHGRADLHVHLRRLQGHPARGQRAAQVHPADFLRRGHDQAHQRADCGRGRGRPAGAGHRQASGRRRVCRGHPSRRVRAGQVPGREGHRAGRAAEAAIGEGGYALPLSDEWLEKERAVLAAELPKMDIVFLSALVPSRIAPILITEDMVKAMKPGAAIVDISIDQGGNCEITPPGEVEVKHNVTLIGIKNIPGMLPESSSWMFAQNIYNLTKYLTKDGKIVLDRNDDIVKGILTTIDGEIVHQGAREAMGL